MSTAFSTDFARQREWLAAQIEEQRIRDGAVLDAVRSVPREAFVPPQLRDSAYRNTALPIDQEQAISQPFIVALMAEGLELKPDDRVLEIGTGSGYAAAVLAKLARDVYTIERHRQLADSARERLSALGFTNIHVLHADGTRGWPEQAPFDGVTVAAAAPRVPKPLRDQLAVDGRLVIPVGRRQFQKLVRLRRLNRDDYQREEFGDVRFVPLVGVSGWNGEKQPG